MATAVERLATHVETLKRGPIDVSTATRLLTLVRQVIETDKTKSTYPTINLYGDWCVHDKLDRKDAQKILAEIEDALRIEMEEKPGHFDHNTMARVVSPRKFGQELSDLLKSKLIDPNVAEPKYLVPILKSVLEEISTKPLELREDVLAQRMKEQRSETERIHIVKSLVIESNPDPQVKANYRLRAVVTQNPVNPNVPEINIASPLIIATDAAGNVVA
jgi:hypothetical protein